MLGSSPSKTGQRGGSLKVGSISIVLAMLFLTGFLVYREWQRPRPEGDLAEGCLFCHRKVSDPDPSHPVSAFGCHGCHLGNPYSIDEERAHFTMVRNPGDLRVVERTCGRSDCHPLIVSRVKNNLMATNLGILKTIQLQWEKREDSAVDVERLLSEDPPDNLAIEYFRKMCGGCHLWKERGDLSGERGRRGGGCSDCHIVDENQGRVSDPMAFDHAMITTKIPSENCVKCHNRSARIGLSYFGRFESAGYGTPYEGKDLSSRRLSGHRFYIQLPSDVHHSKAGMDCVDCHTGVGVMGDGKRYSQMEDQSDITCKACHFPEFSQVTPGDSLAAKLSSLNKRVPAVGAGSVVGRSKKGTPLYNLQRRGEEVIFYRKRDGYPIPMKMESHKGPHHDMLGHERLSCQACHSSWIPQCYGCHSTYRKSEMQRDWLSGKELPGRWSESRSYLRFARPTLGLKDHSTVSVYSPCQVFVSFFDEKDDYRPDLSFRIVTMSSFDPHTTTKEARSCQNCHGDPKSLGLGEGRISLLEGRRYFRPSYDAKASGLGVAFPMDAFTNLDGEELQSTSRKGARPFNKKELDAILFVNACIGCHDRYEDRIYQDFKLSRGRFEKESDLPCRK